MTRSIRSAGVMLVLMLVTMSAAGAAVQEQQAQEQAPDAPPRPDLRVVRVEMTPDPIEEGQPATVTVLIHNRAAVPAAGSMHVQVVHDRGTPQPLPHSREVLYVGADELIELTFTVSDVDIAASPYTFFAVVDARGGIDEEREGNNVSWGRATVCVSADSAETADGRDNDCDGLVDEELGLPVDTSVALAMLRELQDQARLDSVPVLFALARFLAPEAYEIPIRLRSEEGHHIGPDPASGDSVDESFGARLPEDDPTLPLRLIDWNGAPLRSGDTIGLRTATGEAVVATGGGGGVVETRTLFAPREALFSIVLADPAYAGAVIVNGDAVHLVTASGRFWVAEGGGGGEVRADREAPSGWETFTLEFPPQGRR